MAISGIIVEYFSGRMLFIILIPISILVILATHLFVKNILTKQSDHLGFYCVISSILGTGALLYSLGRIGQTGKLGLETILLLILGILVIIYFIRRQLKLEHPLLEIRV